MNVAVGTTNPIKIEATQNIFHQRWPEAMVSGVDVASGVSDQPMSDEEAIRGARQRANNAQQQTKADFGVGIEGSTVDTPSGMMITGWVVIVNAQGQEGIGSGGGFILPDIVARQLRAGHELGQVTDQLFHATNAKQGPGLVGFMTDGIVSRTAGNERAIAYALARFIHPELYSAPQ